MRLFRTILTVAIVTAFSVVPAFAGPPTGAGPQQGPKMLKASPQPPKEFQDVENEAKKRIENPVEKKLTKGELEQKLRIIPGEREKLNNANANRKGDLRTASPQPPKEFQDAENEAKKQIENPVEKKLTKGELEQKLQIIPVEREKLQRIKQGYKPTSQTGETGFSLSWLNPFRVEEAFASTFDLTLSRANRFYSDSPFAYAYFNGLVNSYSYWNYQYLKNFGTFKGYLFFRVPVPATGWYIIDVYASGRNRASLFPYFGGPALMTWDFAGSPSSWNHYVTMQYLAAGGQYFYFKPDFNADSTTGVHSISITSYP